MRGSRVISLGRRGAATRSSVRRSDVAAAFGAGVANRGGPATPKHGVLTRDFPGAIRRGNGNGVVRQEDANNAHDRGAMSNHLSAGHAQVPGCATRVPSDLCVLTSHPG